MPERNPIGTFTATLDQCPNCDAPVLSWTLVTLGPDGVGEGALVVCNQCDMRTGND